LYGLGRRLARNNNSDEADGGGRFSVAVVVVPLSLEILCNGRGKKKASLEPEEVEKFHWVLRTFSRL
jgi:hypothetical protein